MWQCPPLSRRIFISKASSQCCQSNGSYPDRPETYKSWKPEAMEKALDAVAHGVSIRREALDFGIPKSTLGDRASGRVVPESISGPDRILNDEEETEFVAF